MTLAFILRVQVNGVVIGKSSTITCNAVRLFSPGPCYMRTAGSICESVDVQIAGQAFRSAWCGVGPARGCPRSNVVPGAAPVFGELGCAIPRNTRTIDELEEIVRSDHELRVCDCTENCA